MDQLLEMGQELRWKGERVAWKLRKRLRRGEYHLLRRRLCRDSDEIYTNSAVESTLYLLRFIVVKVMEQLRLN